MIRAEIHIVDVDPQGFRQQTTYALTADLGNYSTDVADDLAKRVLTMRHVDAAAIDSETEDET